MRVYISRLNGKGGKKGDVVVKIFLSEGELLRQIPDMIKTYLARALPNAPTAFSPNEVTPEILSSLGAVFTVVDIAAVLRKSPYCLWVRPFVSTQKIEHYGLVIDPAHREFTNGGLGQPDGTEDTVELNQTVDVQDRWLD